MSDSSLDRLHLIDEKQNECCFGHAGIVKALCAEMVKGSMHLNTQDKDGWTPLMWATYGGNHEVVKELLRKGAAVHYTSNDGLSALMLASRTGYVGTARLLLQKGADITRTTKDSKTDKQLAPIEQVGIVQVILKAAS